MRTLWKIFTFSLVILFFMKPTTLKSQEVKISEESEECISCHSELHPGIVKSWEKSRHALITPNLALKKEQISRRISVDKVSDDFANVAVSCYECHSQNANTHADSFEHNGYTIHIVVTPKDCESCHKTEVEQYSQNIMSHAYANLMGNPVYRQLVHSVNGNYRVSDNKYKIGPENDLTMSESCLYCHGTKVEVIGIETRETEFDDLDFPVLKGWPNQGVGRINPDGSLGSCTACHPRHSFSIEIARKPHTCAECHKGPDVPAYKVYEASKHGNIYKSKEKEWDFSAVPWKVGEDFTAPTCAVCHASLITGDEGNIIAERTHRFNDRTAMRLFGVPYSQAHPKSPDQTINKNKAGLPLLSELDGTPVASLLIDKKEQNIRNRRMQQICQSCHSSQWTKNHFARLDNAIEWTNSLTRQGTKILADIWKDGLARGLPQNENIFDEDIERKWTSLWLFYGNSIRFSAAMGGGGDYSVFANGRYRMTHQIMKMQQWYKGHK